MQRAQEKGKRPTRQGRRCFSLALVLFPCAVLATLSGCTSLGGRSSPKSEAPPDPLVGDIVPKGYGPGAPAAPGTATKSKTGVPALPTATSSPSPAEIVQRGQPDPLLGDQQPLRIGNQTGTAQPVGSWQPGGTTGM